MKLVKRRKNTLGTGLSTTSYSILEQHYLMSNDSRRERERYCGLSVTRPLNYFDCDNIHFVFVYRIHSIYTIVFDLKRLLCHGINQ